MQSSKIDPIPGGEDWSKETDPKMAVMMLLADKGLK